jgi:multidrug transporter EmrE-like cation transporter
MLYLILSILFSVLLLANFRIFPRFKVNTLQAIVFNYPVCFATGLALMPAHQHFVLDLSQTWTILALLLGIGFIVTFILSGLSTQKMGITPTSIANNISLVIPVLFSLFVFKSNQNAFDSLNYFGLVLALVSVMLSTYQPSTSGQIQWRYVLLPLAVFMMYGFTNTMINYLNIKYITDADATIPVTLVMVFGAIVSGALLLGYRLLTGKETLEKQNFVASITLGVPNFLSFYFLIKALSAFGNNGALVYPVYNIGVILISALVAMLFFKEKLLTINKIGLALSVLAIGLISYQYFVQ